MSTNEERKIDWQIATLSGGLFEEAPKPRPFFGSTRPIDWEIMSLEAGPISVPPPPPAPRMDSLAPAAMDCAPALALPRPPPLPAFSALPAQPPRPQGRSRLSMATSAIGAAMAGFLVVGGFLRAGSHAEVEPAAPAALEARAATPAAAAPAVAPTPIEVPETIIRPAPAKIAAPAKPAAPVAAAPIAAPISTADLPSIAAEAPAPAKAAGLDRDAALTAVRAAGHRAASCMEAGDARSSMPVSVTFAPSGRVTSARVEGGPFKGTDVGGCIAVALRGAAVGPFDGETTTVRGTIRVR
jgi:hypothetical protein